MTLIVAAVRLREKRQMAEAIVEDIHAQLDALDPVTRGCWKDDKHLHPIRAMNRVV